MREAVGREIEVLTVKLSTLVVVASKVAILPSLIVVKPFRVEAAEVNEVLTVRLSDLVVVELRVAILALVVSRVNKSKVLVLFKALLK